MGSDITQIVNPFLEFQFLLLMTKTFVEAAAKKERKDYMTFPPNFNSNWI